MPTNGKTRHNIDTQTGKPTHDIDHTSRPTRHNIDLPWVLRSLVAPNAALKLLERAFKPPFKNEKQRLTESRDVGAGQVKKLMPGGTVLALGQPNDRISRPVGVNQLRLGRGYIPDLLRGSKLVRDCALTLPLLLVFDAHSRSSPLLSTPLSYAPLLYFAQ